MKSRLPQNLSGGMRDINSLSKQAQKLQDQIMKTQEEIEAREFSTTSGGGAVEVVMTGRKKLVSLNIKPEAVDPEDVEMLQDLIISAINDVVEKIEETSQNEMSELTGGVAFPGMF
jgi:DNA-binding YbaB/EbfC family protein